ncbi:MAG TPA: alpha/beta hydrolase-fold protein [Cellulomonas sp.]
MSPPALRLDPAGVLRLGADLRHAEVVLLGMHGYGGDQHELSGAADALPPDVALLLPRGPLTTPEGAAAWFPAGEPGSPTLAEADAAVVAVDVWLRGLGALPPVVPFGFSQGGAVALHLLRTHPDQFPAAGSLAGFTVDAVLPGDADVSRRSPPTVAVWDPDDDVVVPRAVARTHAWLVSHTRARCEPRAGMGHRVRADVLAGLCAGLVGAVAGVAVAGAEAGEVAHG